MNYIYKFLDKNNNVLYIGKTTNLKNRISQHYSNGHLSDECYLNCKEIKYMEFENKIDMDLAEIYFINKYKPIYNIASNYMDKCSFDIDIEKEWDEYDFDIEKSKYLLVKANNELISKAIVELSEIKNIQQQLNNRILELESIINGKILIDNEMNIDIRSYKNTKEFKSFIYVLKNIYSQITNFNDECKTYMKFSRDNSIIYYDLKYAWGNIIDIKDAYIDRKTFLNMCKKYRIISGSSNEYYRSTKFVNKNIRAYALNIKSILEILEA